MEESNKYKSTNRYIIPEDEYKSPRMIQIDYIKDDSIHRYVLKFNYLDLIKLSNQTHLLRLLICLIFSMMILNWEK